MAAPDIGTRNCISCCCSWPVRGAHNLRKTCTVSRRQFIARHVSASVGLLLNGAKGLRAASDRPGKHLADERDGEAPLLHQRHPVEAIQQQYQVPQTPADA